MDNTLKLLDDFAKYCKEEQKNIPYNFNILDEQCGHIVENSHTNVLMKLLEYKNHYGYVFLNNFLSNICNGFDDIKDDIKDYEKEEVSFVREKYYLTGRIDGLIYQKDRFALIIENKVNGAGNTDKQLKKYIEGVLKDKNIFDEHISDKEGKIWVVFLTKDGNENPDNESVEYMLNNGICDKDKTNKDNIEGQRYRAISYKENILPWLKEEIQPIVMQKEQILNTGLIQYIDFLEGMLGERSYDKDLINNGKEWLKEWLENNGINLSETNKMDKFKVINKHLNKIKIDIDKSFKERIKKKNDDSNIAELRRYAGILNNLIDEFNEEPMKDFIEITSNYFDKKIKDSNKYGKCVIRHVWNYYYIQIRYSSWPRSVHFEWYMGVGRLVEKNPKDSFTFCFHVEKTELRDVFKDEKIKKCFEEHGFDTLTETQKILSFSKNVTVNDSGNPFHKDRQELNVFLEETYSSIDSELIETINNILEQTGTIQK